MTNQRRSARLATATPHPAPRNPAQTPPALDTEFRLPPLVIAGRSPVLGTFLDHLNVTDALSLDAKQFLTSFSTHIRVSEHLHAMVQMTGPELEGLAKVAARGLLLSKDLPCAFDPAETELLLRPFLLKLRTADSRPVLASNAPNPLVHRCEHDESHMEPAVFDALLEREEGESVIQGWNFCLEVFRFLPRSVLFDGMESPFWATTFLLFGAEATQKLKTNTTSWDVESIANGICEALDMLNILDLGRIGLDYVAHGRGYIDVKFLRVDSVLKLNLKRTFHPKDPGGESGEPRSFGHGAVLRISTSDPERLPVPTRLVVEARSAFLRLWISCGMCADMYNLATIRLAAQSRGSS